MSGPKVLPRMSWDDQHPTDPAAVVLWWTRVPGDRLAEVHHLRSHRGRLRLWLDRGHGPLVYDQPVRISKDGRNGPEPQDIEQWQRMLRTFIQSEDATTSTAGADS